MTTRELQQAAAALAAARDALMAAGAGYLGIYVWPSDTQKEAARRRLTDAIIAHCNAQAVCAEAELDRMDDARRAGEQ